jgi:hypothetical protein
MMRRGRAIRRRYWGDKEDVKLRIKSDPIHCPIHTCTFTH